MSASLLKMQEERAQSLFAMCDIKSLCDVTLVSDDGFTNAHKLILLKVFPELKYLLCTLCHDDHENITIIVPGVNKSDLKAAVKNLYLTADFIKLGYILGLDVDLLQDITEEHQVETATTKTLIEEKVTKTNTLNDTVNEAETLPVMPCASSELLNSQVSSDPVSFLSKDEKMMNCDQCEFQTGEQEKLLEH